MKIVHAIESWQGTPKPRLFMAGSIEMGAAEHWQERLSIDLAYHTGTILNPRRDDWDASWVQSIDNRQFREQVEWELAGLEVADVIALYLSPGTKSPISLLELGLFRNAPGLCVFCPSGFWRKGNVDIVCRRYSIAQAEKWDSWVGAISIALNDHRDRRPSSSGR